jgi:ATP-dependent RNA helicase RhlE
MNEADHMFDMGFLPSIRRIIGTLPAKRQPLLFSATMPDEIRRLVMKCCIIQ